jgi:hypothetical protein
MGKYCTHSAAILRQLDVVATSCVPLELAVREQHERKAHRPVTVGTNNGRRGNVTDVQIQ